MKSLLVIVVLGYAASIAHATWFSDVVTGIQESIKDSFEEAQKDLEKSHLQTPGNKQGVKEFLAHLNQHVNTWKRKFAEEHEINGTKALNKKAKKLWKKLQKHVLHKLTKGNETDNENLKKKMKKHHKKHGKKHNRRNKVEKKRQRKEKHEEKEEEKEEETEEKPDLIRVPLIKDNVMGAKRLIKAQKIFNKLANMWSKSLKERRKDFMTDETEPQEKKEEEPSPETETEEETRKAEEKYSAPILSNPQEIAKKVLKYARLVKMPSLNIPQKEILKRTSQFFQMHKPKDLETGPYMSKEEEEKMSKEVKSTILNSQVPQEADKIDERAEEIVKEQEKKFEELEKQWEERLKLKAEKTKEEVKRFPSMKDIPSKTILPAFIKMESVPGHREESLTNVQSKEALRKKELIGGAEDVSSVKEAAAMPNEQQVLILPNMERGEEVQRSVEPKKEEKKKDNEELWVKLPDTELKTGPEKVSPQAIEKMDGDLPRSLEKEETEDTADKKEPEEPVIEEPKEEMKPVEETEPTVNPGHLQELDDEGFRKRLMQEEEEWMQFKKTLMQKFNKLKQKVDEHPLGKLRNLGKRLNLDKYVPIMTGIAEKVAKKTGFEEP